MARSRLIDPGLVCTEKREKGGFADQSGLFLFDVCYVLDNNEIYLRLMYVRLNVTKN